MNAMRKFFLLICLALCCSVSASAQVWIHLNRYAADNAALEAPQGARVVLYGDSITDGWPNQRPEFFAETGFVGRGISGEESCQMLLRFRADVIDIQASHVVILAGINDIAINQGGPYNEDLTFSNIVSMVDLAWQNGIRPVVCSVLPSYHFRWRTEITDVYEKVCSLNARLQAYCERNGITYVDYFSAMAGTDGKIRSELSADTVHPNAAGYAIMERVLLDSLR